METKNALILAAGMGTRLAPITNDRPKSLVPVNGKPILIRQIEALYQNGVTDITIISGYMSYVLEECVHELYPNIRVVESKDYSKTNNMYSAYIGLRQMFPNGEFEPFYLMNADVFFDNSVLETLKNDRRENLIVVDAGIYLEESMKVIEKDGRLVSISKEISRDDALGCSIDVYRFAEDGGKAFYDRCVDYIENKRELRLWSEVALNDALSDVEFYACPLVGRWIEIDNHQDLAMAEELFKETKHD